MSLYKGTSSNASLLILYILYDIVLHTRTLGQITGIEPEALIIKKKKEIRTLCSLNINTKNPDTKIRRMGGKLLGVGPS